MGLRQLELPERDFLHVSEFVMSPRVMEDLYLGKAGMRSKLTPEEKLILARHYPHPNYMKLLAVDGSGPRSEWRVETRFPARVGLTRGLSEIWDVSPSGLKLSTTEKLEVGSRLTLRINLNRSVQAAVGAEVRWVAGGQLYGLRVETANSAWGAMTKALETRWLKLASGTSSALDSKVLA